jgi:hypothetical protein
MTCVTLCRTVTPKSSKNAKTNPDTDAFKVLSKHNLNVTLSLFFLCRFDDFAYFYHRYDLPLLNYTICTNAGNLNDLHSKFMPRTVRNGPSVKDVARLQHLMRKPVWQVLHMRNAKLV